RSTAFHLPTITPQSGSSSAMASDLVRFMHALFLPAAASLHGPGWQPSADVYRTRDGWLVKFDLACVRPEDTQVVVDGRYLVLRLLPIKNTVLFPYLFAPLAVGRQNSRAAIEAVVATEEKTFLVTAQKNADAELPALDDLYRIGTRAVVKKMGRSERGIEILAQGIERVRILALEQ